LIVMGMAVLMALMSCTNVAGLLLVRVARRTREISVRYALGAQRRRLMQQLLAEGTLLGFAGGVFGIALAPQIAALLIRTAWARDASHLAFTSHTDLRILAFNFGLALFVSVLFSLVPECQEFAPLRPLMIPNLPTPIGATTLLSLDISPPKTKIRTSSGHA